MPLITTYQHPKNVFVITACDNEMKEAAQMTKLAMDEAEYAAVLVYRPETFLKQTFQIASKASAINTYPNAFVLNPENPHKNQVAERIRTVENYKSKSVSEVGKTYGPDFRIFAEFSKHLGISTTAIRSRDENNSQAHIDIADKINSYYPDDTLIPPELYEDTDKMIPHSVVTTMAINGYSTFITETKPEELLYFGTKWSYISKADMHPDKCWYGPLGSITVIRSNGWGKHRPPCVHLSQKREQDGNPDERLVGVSFLYGL